MSITRVRLDSVCDVIMGQAPSGEAYNLEGKGWPLIAGAGDFGAVHPAPKKFTTEASKLSKPGDIILGIRATIGEKVLSDGEYCLGRGVAALRANPKLESRFLWHWLDHTRPILSAKAKGATFKQVNRQDIKELEITLPPIAEQKRIAAILDKAEELRELRRQALRELDAIAQAIFIEMFGDPATNPKGWFKAILGDVIHSAKDGPHVSPKYVEDGIPFLSTRHVRYGEVVWEDLKFISNEDAKMYWKRGKPEAGDILYTKGGTTGIAKIIDFEQDFAFWVHLALLKPDISKVDSRWLENMLNGDFCYRQSQRFTHGIANRDLGLKRMIKIKIYLPPLPLQQEFARRIESIEQLKTTHRESLTQLDALFASLQHRAFRGEL